METIKFTKMHGLGNDYVYIDCMKRCPDRLNELAREMSDRHCGVGGDGIILILPSEIADFRMRMFNADGSEGAMCGNGARCIGKYVYDHGLTDRTNITLETLSGVKFLTLYPGKDGKIESITVDMGEPVFDTEKIPVDAPRNTSVKVTVPSGREVELTAVSMGNPHGVIFTDDLSDEMVLDVGSQLEVHPVWPDRANIEFARVEGPGNIRMRVWERGSGETMACGTGACATAVAAALTGHAGRDSVIHLLGGDLSIRWDEKTNHVLMTGPATEVFNGTYQRQNPEQADI